MAKAIPPHFDVAFLQWFREQTEDAWSNYPTTTFEQYVAAGVGGQSWQQETRWLNGLSERELVAIEQQYQMRFPPDYRLFLQVLHSVDRLTAGARYSTDDTMIPINKSSFYNWQTDTAAITDAYEAVIDGLLFDVQNNNLWPQSWGERPTTPETQEAHIRQLVHAAPRLIPIIGHRFLLAEPCQAGNPILSIHQSDMIIYGVDLHDYFLTEFADLLDIKHAYGTQLTQERFQTYKKIPF